MPFRRPLKCHGMARNGMAWQVHDEKPWHGMAIGSRNGMTGPGNMLSTVLAYAGCLPFIRVTDVILSSPPVPVSRNRFRIRVMI